MLRTIDRSLGRGLALLPLLAACASLPAWADEDRMAAPVKTPSRLLYEELDLGDGVVPQTIVCRVQVDLGLKGRPESVGTDAFCPEAVANEVRKTVRKWRWDAEGWGGNTTMDVQVLRLSEAEAQAARERFPRPLVDGSQLGNGLRAAIALEAGMWVGVVSGGLVSSAAGLATCGGFIVGCSSRAPDAFVFIGSAVVGTSSAVAVVHRRSRLPVGLTAASTVTLGMFFSSWLPSAGTSAQDADPLAGGRGVAAFAVLLGPPVVTGLVAGAVRSHPPGEQLPLWQIQLGTTPDGTAPTLGLSGPL